MNDIALLGNRIQTLRKERKLTLNQLASLANISQGYLSKVENGKHDPTFSVLLQIARALKVQVGYLYEDCDQEENYTIIRVEDRIKRVHPDMEYTHWEFPTRIKDRKMFAYITEPPQVCPLVEGNDERIYFVLEGEFQINGQEILREGDAVYFAPNTPHTGISIGKKPARIFSVISSLDKTE